jgi:hypothetical protein
MQPVDFLNETSKFPLVTPWYGVVSSYFLEHEYSFPDPASEPILQSEKDAIDGFQVAIVAETVVPSKNIS